jgi:hypothetical protein
MADYSALVADAGKTYNIDPALISAVIQTESSGNPKAVSPVGAVGLGQLMPATAKALGVTDPTDPAQAIPAVARLLNENLTRYGNVQDALRAYHGGTDQANWGPLTQAYPKKVLSRLPQMAQPQAQTLLPGIPGGQTQGNLSDDAILSAFTKGAAPAQAPQQGPSDDQILAAFTKAPAAASSPSSALAAQQQGSTEVASSQPGGVMSFLAGLGRGVQETVLGGQQLLGHGLELAGHIGESPTLSSLITGQQPMNMIGRAGQWLVGDAARGLQAGAQEIAPYQQAHPIATGAGNIAGSIAATAPLGGVVGPGAGLLGRVSSGAASGALGSALAPVDPNNPNYWQAKASQVGLGALTGGVAAPIIGGISRVISPNVSSDVQTLLDKGVTPTPGQILGGGFARTEDKLTSVPFLGDMIKGAQQRAVNQFNAAAYNEALAPIGETFSGKVGQEGIEQVGKQIGNVYDTVLPKMQLRVDPQFQADVTNLGQMANGLPDSQQKTFMNVLKTQIFDKLTAGGSMDGQTLKGVQSELARTASGYLKDPSFDNRQLGAAVSALRDAVDGNLARVNPPDLAQQLSNANQAWANFARLRAAAASMGAANNEGVFTAAQLQNAVKAGDKSVGKGAFATGNALMQDLSGAGQRVLGSKYPDSGTAGRGLLALLAPGGVAAGLATAPGSTLGTLGGIGLGSLPYTQLGQRAAAALLTARPQLAQPLGNLVGKLGPVVIPGGTAALLSNGGAAP